MSRQVDGISCMSPIAPTREVIGWFSPDIVRPPLSACITLRIQVSGTLNRLRSFRDQGFPALHKLPVAHLLLGLERTWLSGGNGRQTRRECRSES